MRLILLVTLGLGLLSVLPAGATIPPSDSSGATYHIPEIDESTVFKFTRDEPGKKGLYITCTFKIFRHAGKGEMVMASDVARDEIEVREDGKVVEELDLVQPTTQDLTTVLAIDVSGSMKNDNKIDQARKAASAFLDRLKDRADTGLILFDHQVPEHNPQRFQKPAGDPARYAAHRQKLRELIARAEPLGGTAYLDAAARAIDMLREATGRRAVLLLTDGVDMNSRLTLKQVIDKAVAAQVPIYTVGVGPPGKDLPVTTVLVLDHSGSMRGKASDRDRKSKMDALKQAAGRFVELMRPKAQTTLLPFSTTISSPEKFSSNKKALIARIGQLEPEGGTLLYDATLAGVETLQAERLTGRKAVVVLTDGKDESPGSRHSDQEVIDRAGRKTFNCTCSAWDAHGTSTSRSWNG